LGSRGEIPPAAAAEHLRRLARVIDLPVGKANLRWQQRKDEQEYPE
jgi:hypothetical protein